VARARTWSVPTPDVDQSVVELRVGRVAGRAASRRPFEDPHGRGSRDVVEHANKCGGFWSGIESTELKIPSVVA